MLGQDSYFPAPPAGGALVHPLLRELFAMLPRPGEHFTVADRVRWLEASYHCLELVHPRPEGEPPAKIIVTPISESPRKP